jgi:ectoine hydroxylase-related dioxygenase (phytanoyl-CoA dioxygenase family)
MYTSMMLSQEQTKQYHDEGYLVFPNLLSEQEVEEFIAYETTQDPEWRNHLDNHKRDEPWARAAKHPYIVGIVQQILDSKKPMIVQTMYLEKRPAEAGKGTALHQDSHYLPNEPNTLMACWLAMSDTGGENGGLCVVAGSHTVGLYSTHKATNLKDHRMWESEHLMRDRGGREWKEKFYSFEIDNLDTSRVLNLKVPKGSGVFFSSHTIHGSYGDKSAGRIRRAFATHFVDESTWVFRADVQNVVPAI